MSFVKVSCGSNEPDETLLWENPNVDRGNLSMTLSDSITNYKYIKFICRCRITYDMSTFQPFYVSLIFSPQQIINYPAPNLSSASTESGTFLLPFTTFTSLKYNTYISESYYYTLKYVDDTHINLICVTQFADNYTSISPANNGIYKIIGMN